MKYKCMWELSRPSRQNIRWWIHQRNVWNDTVRGETLLTFLTYCSAVSVYSTPPRTNITWGKLDNLTQSIRNWHPHKKGKSGNILTVKCYKTIEQIKHVSLTSPMFVGDAPISCWRLRMSLVGPAMREVPVSTIAWQPRGQNEVTPWTATLKHIRGWWSEWEAVSHSLNRNLSKCNKEFNDLNH